MIMNDYLTKDDLNQLCNQYHSCAFCEEQLNGSVRFWCHYHGGHHAFTFDYKPSKIYIDTRSIL